MSAVADYPRIQELERRVARDPASIAFAQLAEEYRRVGRLAEAVQVARAGLERYPAYVSARVTLGRALLELERYDDAYAELEAAVRVAPDNLAAIRALADLHQRRRHSQSSGSPREAIEPAAAPPPIPFTPPPQPIQVETLPAAALSVETERTTEGELTEDTGANSGSDATGVEELDRSSMETAVVSEQTANGVADDDYVDGRSSFEPAPEHESVDPALTVLEAWLEAVLADRARRRAPSVR